MEKEFNQTVVYGLDSNVFDIISMARRFPMMANHQVLIVREAQNLKESENISSYLQNPLKSTILVLVKQTIPNLNKANFNCSLIILLAVANSKPLFIFGT